MLQTITSPLCDPIMTGDKSLKINLNITINRDGKYAFSKLSNESGDFITVDVSPRIIMRYYETKQTWSGTQQIVINQRNIFGLQLGLKRFYNNFQRDNLYKYDNDGRITELLSTNRDTIVIQLIKDQVLRLSPSIVEDNRGRIYPGVNLTLNREENNIDITVDEFEMVMSALVNANVYQLGMLLLQTYIGMTKRSIEDDMNSNDKRKVPKTNTIKYSTSGSMFENRESVSGAPIKSTTPLTLEDLQ